MWILCTGVEAQDPCAIGEGGDEDLEGFRTIDGQELLHRLQSYDPTK